MAAASLDMAAARTEPRRAEPVAPAPAPVAPPIPAQTPVQAKAEERTAEFAPPVFAAREPVIDQSIAADFLDAARERVLPDLNPGQTTPPHRFRPDLKIRLWLPMTPNRNFPTSLASDFESFLEAEIAKSKEADNEPSIAPAAEKQAKTQPASPPVTGASPDGDMQKEMARIFGELSVTRDR